MRDLLLPQRICQPSLNDLRVEKGCAECRVHLQSLVLSFLDDVVDVTDIEFGDEFTAWRASDAVDGPESRGLSLVRVVRIGDCDGGVKGLVVWRRMIRGERDVILGMHVLCRYSKGPWKFEKVVDDGRNRAAVSHRQTAILHTKSEISWTWLH